MTSAGNILETFLANGWPKNQHAYTTGRGVGTAWKVILKDVIHYKNIYENDFTGFFNTINFKAVADTLLKFQVPKFVTIHLLELCSSDVDNITGKKFLNYVNDKSVELDFPAAWLKHEYIHKYRRGWRSRGLPQGFSLGPILSVLPLIVLDELKHRGVENLSYADDGLFYSDTKLDFTKLAQDTLDKWDVGAFFNLDKCKSVKEDGVWKSNLKFVGLTYDPWRNVLSASTRNGSSLPLSLTAIAKFKSTPVVEKAINAYESKLIQYGDYYDNLFYNCEANSDSANKSYQIFNYKYLLSPYLGENGGRENLPCLLYTSRRYEVQPCSWLA